MHLFMLASLALCKFEWISHKQFMCAWKQGELIDPLIINCHLIIINSLLLSKMLHPQHTHPYSLSLSEVIQWKIYAYVMWYSQIIVMAAKQVIIIENFSLAIFLSLASQKIMQKVFNREDRATWMWWTPSSKLFYVLLSIKLRNL